MVKWECQSMSVKAVNWITKCKNIETYVGQGSEMDYTGVSYCMFKFTMVSLTSYNIPQNFISEHVLKEANQIASYICLACILDGWFCYAQPLAEHM